MVSLPLQFQDFPRKHPAAQGANNVSHDFFFVKKYMHVNYGIDLERQMHEVVVEIEKHVSGTGNRMTHDLGKMGFQ